MAEQLFFEDIAVGTEVPLLVKTPSTRQLVAFAGASGDFNEIHYDQEFARSTGLSDIIVHGRLKAAFLTQLITDWIGEKGMVRKMSVRYRGMDYARQPITCRGKVTDKYRQGDECWIVCDVWAENPNGEQTTTGSFAVTVPSRSKD